MTVEPGTASNVFVDWAAFVAAVRERRIAVFLDYDGTLTPIVDKPEWAVLPESMRARLRALAESCPTAVVSGRGLEDVRALIGIDALVYAGSHGFDIAGPGIRREVDASVVPVLERVFERLRRPVAAIPGATVEHKRFAIAVHHRLVAEDDAPRVERLVDEAIRSEPGLRKTHGKKVFEVRPALAWDKGHAVRWLIEALGLGGDEVCPIYVGDDVTDEDAFRAIAADGLGIRVADAMEPTAARYTVRDVGEVAELLDRLTTVASRRGHSEFRKF